MGFAAGCKPKASEGSAGSDAYFATPFQTESEFVVQAIVSDLAEQMFYAASKRLPDKKVFEVAAVEKPGSPADAPVFEVRVQQQSSAGGGSRLHRRLKPADLGGSSLTPRLAPGMSLVPAFAAG